MIACGLLLLALTCVPGPWMPDLDAQEPDRIPVHQVRAEDLAPELDSLFDESTATVRDSMAAHDVPGLAIAVVDRDRILWTAGFGVRDRDTGEPVTPETVFSVQSISKLFTAVTAMRAVEEGILDLDADVTDYLPDFTVNSRFSEDPVSRMTVRHLLRHAAGFPHEAPVGNNWDAYSPSMEAHVRSISDTWLEFPVGTDHAYSNLGYDLVGYIIQKQSGRRYQEYMREELLDPLGMTASFVDTAGQRLCPSCAAGHRTIFDSMPEYVPMTASGGVRATADNAARFAQFLLRFGETPDGARILGASSFDEIYRPTGQARDRGWPDRWFGMGVIVERGTGDDYLLHTHGGGFGYRASLQWMPELGIGAAVFTNSDDHDQIDADLAVAVLDSMAARELVEEVDAPGVPRAASFFKNLPDTTVYRSTDTTLAPTPYREEWKRYAGTYRLIRGEGYEYAPSADLSRFEVEITEKDGHLHFGSEPLIEHEPGLFFGAESGVPLDFRDDPPTWANIELERVETASTGE